MSSRAGGSPAFAFLLANARYWPTVAPLARAQLAIWDEEAASIPDDRLRRIATGKLNEERFNSEVAATLATLAPKAHREQTVCAIVALQVLYDYLDALGEQPVQGTPTADGRLFQALGDAVGHAGEGRPPSGGHSGPAHEEALDGGYLQALVGAVRSSIAQLPASGATARVMRTSAERCVEAQAHVHESSELGLADLLSWATQQASGTGMQWQEFLAGASASVLSLHALIAASADSRTTHVQAAELDGLYLCIGVLTMLDSLVDYQADLDSSTPGYVQFYNNDPNELAERISAIARDACERARGLPHGAHHVMTLVGVVAYYGSAPQAKSEIARPAFSRLRRELGPMTWPTLALMRGWRLAKRIRA